jgi:hypothetical protein
MPGQQEGALAGKPDRRTLGPGQLRYGLVAGDVRDGAVIRVGLADGELSVSYDNPG